jgi:hypothetical protein
VYVLTCLVLRHSSHGDTGYSVKLIWDFKYFGFPAYEIKQSSSSVG